MSSTNTCTWCVLHKQDWLANYGPRKRNVLFVMIVANILMLIMTWHLPVLIEVLCMYQICVMMTLFAYTLSYRKIWKDVQRSLPNLTWNDHEALFVYTTKCYTVRAFAFSIFWPAFFLPRSPKKGEYCRQIMTIVIPALEEAGIFIWSEILVIQSKIGVFRGYNI